MKDNNQIAIKSKAFAVRMIRLYQYLTNEKREHVLSKQVLRSGTSIGANIREADNAQSKKDFVAKMQIALKEAGETEYWLELLQDTEYISGNAGENLRSDCHELYQMITAIIKTAKTNLD